MKHKQWPNQIYVDFSAESSLKDALREKLLLELDRQPNDRTELEGIPMKKTIKYSTRVALIALISIVLISAVALAALKTFSLGPFATYTETDGPKTMEQAISMLNEHRADWDGKLFDENGNPVDDLTAYFEGMGETNHIYDAQGVEVVLDFEDGKIILKDRAELDNALVEVSTTQFTTKENVRPFLAFDFGLPTYLPDGYVLDYFSVYNDDDGNPFEGLKYLTIVYTKAGEVDSELHLSLRLMDKETAFESGSSASMRALKINGHDAVTDEKNVDLLVGDVLYEFMPMKSGLPLDEVVKMAESIEP